MKYSFSAFLLLYSSFLLISHSIINGQYSHLLCPFINSVAKVREVPCLWMCSGAVGMPSEDLAYRSLLEDCLWSRLCLKLEEEGTC